MPTLLEKFKVPHFDAKGEANKFFAQADVPTTWLNTSFYWDNAIGFGLGPKKGPDGKLGLTLPMADKKLPGLAVEDIGKCALGVFKAGSEYIGKTIGIAGGHLTGAEMAAGFGKALGQEVTYNPIPAEVFRGFGFPGADDLGNMFQYKAEFNEEFCAARPLDLAKKLNPDMLTFEKWLEKYADKIPLS
jgi:uncharacterized protein YbjT (DUF2867 family)